MKVEQRDGLLFTSISLEHGGHRFEVPNMIVDTGAAQSLISMDVVDDLFQRYELGDELVTMGGIGGSSIAVRRKVDCVVLDDYSAKDFSVDFATMESHPGVNGLVGFDLLSVGMYIIDLRKMQVWSGHEDCH